MNDHGGEPGNQIQMPKLPKGAGKKLAWVVVAAVVVGFGSTTFYTVQEQERAAVLTFGKFDKEERAGLRFKLPYPIQEVVKVPAEITQRLQIGYKESNGKITVNEHDALMITGDENIVAADAVVEWKVSSLEKYLYNIEDPERFLDNAAKSAIRSVIGSTKLDYAITDGKTEVQMKVKERLEELNTLYDTGIFISDIKFQDIEPPEGDVQQAFREVTNAREEKNTKINNARKYENDIIPKARGEAQALIEEAEGIKQSRILNAQGDVAQFNAVYAEYIKNPGVTSKRLMLETMEKVLPKAKVIITDGSGDTVKYLPLNDMLRSSTPKGGTTP